MTKHILLLTDSEKSEKIHIKNAIADKKMPDYAVYIIEPDERELSIVQIRDFLETIYKSVIHSRLFICKKFDFATIEAQNAMLKVLEDKHITDSIILCAQELYRILPTVRSRLTVIDRRGDKDIKVGNKTKLVLDTVYLEKNLGKAILLCENEEKNIINPVQFFDESLFYFRLILLENNKDISEIMKKILYFRNAVMTRNANIHLCIDQLLIFIYKKTNMKGI